MIEDDIYCFSENGVNCREGTTPNTCEFILNNKIKLSKNSLANQLKITPDICGDEKMRGWCDIKQFKSKKHQITAEVSPHHLYFIDEDIDSFDTNLKVAPPVRNKKDRKALIEGIKSGLIDCIATDHAPHTLEEKETTFNEAAFGMIGLESCFGVVNKVLVKENGMSLKSLIEKITVNPRKVLNLEPNLFAIGSKAQITIFDPNKKWKFKNCHILSKSSNSPFVGKDLVGKVKFVISKNQFFAL